MSQLLRESMDIQVKRQKIKDKIQTMFDQFEDKEEQRHETEEWVDRNVLFVGLSMSGKTIIQNVLKNPRTRTDEARLFSQQNTYVSFQRDLPFPTFRMKVNCLELPQKYIDEQSSLSQINGQCLKSGLEDFHLICLCMSFSAGIDASAMDAFERFIKYFGPKQLAPNLCLIITRCELKDSEQRKRLTNQFLEDSESEFIGEHLNRGIHFFGALRNDDLNQANTSLIQQFQTVYQYRNDFLNLLRMNIQPFHFKEIILNPSPIRLPPKNNEETTVVDAKCPRRNPHSTIIELQSEPNPVIPIRITEPPPIIREDHRCSKTDRTNGRPDSISTEEEKLVMRRNEQSRSSSWCCRFSVHFNQSHNQRKLISIRLFIGNSLDCQFSLVDFINII